jgi:hypothetical protein
MELWAAITVLLASRLGLPVSTTWYLTGATVGVALMNFQLGAVNWRQILFIFSGWLMSLPIAGLMSGLLMLRRWIRLSSKDSQMSLQDRDFCTYAYNAMNYFFNLSRFYWWISRRNGKGFKTFSRPLFSTVLAAEESRDYASWVPSQQ